MRDPTIAYGALSYWHDSALAPQGSKQIEQGTQYDVIIIGGGITGLWTAYQLLTRKRLRSIALLEQEEVGFGSSGRCAGLVTPRIGPTLEQMVREYGLAGAQTLWHAGKETIQEAADVIETEKVECEVRSGELVTVAASEINAREVYREIAVAERMGLNGVNLYNNDDARNIVCSSVCRLRMTELHCISVHPLKLIRGLATAAARRGLAVFERSGSATVHDEGNSVRVECPAGSIHAEQAVIATNAWIASDQRFRQSVVPKYSYLIATEPLSDETWSRLGGNRWLGLLDKRKYTHVARTTLDGRIIWGRDSAVTTFRSGIGPHRDRDERVFRSLQASLTASFPQLGRVGATHAWGGPIAATPDGWPRHGSLSPRVHYSFGHGMRDLGPSFLGGRILCDLVSGERTDVTAAIGVEKPPTRYLLKPVRFVATHFRQGLADGVGWLGRP